MALPKLFARTANSATTPLSLSKEPTRAALVAALEEGFVPVEPTTPTNIGSAPAFRTGGFISWKAGAEARLTAASRLR